MPKRLPAALSLGLGLTLFAAACNGDRSPLAPAAPAAVAPQGGADQGLLGGLLGGVTGTVSGLLNATVSVVTRSSALSEDVSWSFYAGPQGAVSYNRQLGLTMTVPPAALSKTVKITVTARKGNVVDYHFEPEGLQFAIPAVLTQDLSLTSVVSGLTTTLTNTLTGKTLKGAYYSADKLQYDPKTGTAVVNEFEPTVTSGLLGTVSFQIKHFSGYVVASCDSDGGFLGGW
jgi:hypothetical protein